jgi:hypothetical protein
VETGVLKFLVMKVLRIYVIILLLLAATVSLLSCEKDLSFEDNNSNQPPVANAGSHQRIALPKDSAVLDGSASSDVDGSIAEWQWTKIAGPSSFAIDSSGAAKTIVRNLAAGIYQFELKVKDNGGLSAIDTVLVMVDDNLTNQPPVAHAGADQVFDSSTAVVVLDGSQSADPENNITSFVWTKVSGPAPFNITNANAVQPQVTGLVQGVYQFELKVTDAGGLLSKDTVQLTVNVTSMTNECGSNRPQVAARLIPVGSLSKPRVRMAVGTVGTKILFAGGNAQDEPNGSSRVDIYDINSKTWSTAELSTPRYDITAITAGDKVFFAGGNNPLPATTVDIYDASTNTWSVTALPLPRSGMAAAAIGGKVFFAGGPALINGVAETDRVEIYDLATRTWSVRLLTERKYGVSAVTLGNKIYFAGGIYHYGGMGADDYTHISDRIEIYDNATGTWTTSTLSEGKYALAGIAVGNKIYWAGGYNSKYLCKVEIMDVFTQTTSLAYLSTPGIYTAVPKNNKVVCFKLAPSDGTFDVHDVNTNTWTVGTLPVNLVWPSVISVSNTVYVAGGFLNNMSNTFNNISDKVYILEF